MARASPLDSGNAEANGECTWRVRRGPDDKHPEPPQPSVADLAGGDGHHLLRWDRSEPKHSMDGNFNGDSVLRSPMLQPPHLVESGRAEAGQ